MNKLNHAFTKTDMIYLIRMTRSGQEAWAELMLPLTKRIKILENEVGKNGKKRNKGIPNK